MKGIASPMDYRRETLARGTRKATTQLRLTQASPTAAILSAPHFVRGGIYCGEGI